MTDPNARPLKLSVVIVNYNYETYVREAIESALAIDWPEVEIIVVDDGSTDGSRAVIESYEPRISAIFQENSTQRVAANRAIEQCTGDLVLFLDADDLVEPSIMQEAAKVYEPGVSKIQFQMYTIDAEGRPLGTRLPQYRIVPTSAQIRQWARTAASYPTPPASANIFAMDFARKIFPIPDTCGAMTDSYTLAASPYLGAVVTVPKPLVAYRMHGKNMGAMSKADAYQARRQLMRAQQRAVYAAGIAKEAGISVSPGAFDRSLSVLPYRIASFRLAPHEHPMKDSRAGLLRMTIQAVLTPQGWHTAGRLALLGWCLAMLAAPLPLAEKLVLWRFAPGSRPKVLGQTLRRLRVIS